MLYFSEIKTWETFKGKQDDFHLNYNSNSGGGQQRLAGSFFDSKGSLTPSSSLNGKYANFAFEINQPNGSSNLVQISSDNVTYQITTRGGESECVRLWVDGKDGKCNPSKALPAFLMLPPTCGVKKPSNLENSILSTSNYWLQSMWLKVDAMPNNKVLFKPIDCIVSGGIDKDGNGEQRFFAINFDQRFSDIIAIADDNQIDHDIRSAVNHFADIYKGVNVFNYDESTRVIANLMNYLFSRYFDRYSGTLDPLTFIRELSMSHKTPAPAKQTVLNQLVPHRGPVNSSNTEPRAPERAMALKKFSERTKIQSGQRFIPIVITRHSLDVTSLQWNALKKHTSSKARRPKPRMTTVIPFMRTGLCTLMSHKPLRRLMCARGKK